MPSLTFDQYLEKTPQQVTAYLKQIQDKYKLKDYTVSLSIGGYNYVIKDLIKALWLKGVPLTDVPDLEVYAKVGVTHLESITRWAKEKDQWRVSSYTAAAKKDALKKWQEIFETKP